MGDALVVAFRKRILDETGTEGTPAPSKRHNYRALFAADLSSEKSFAS